MSQSDRTAAAAVVAHHEQLAAALTRQVAELVEAAAIGSLRRTWAVRDALVGWVHTELLPHAYAEEEALYPAAARRPEAKLLVDGMLGEHRAIAELVTELETTPSPVAAAAAARALRAVFEAHLAKENELIVPVLVEAGDVDLAALLAGMHELLGEDDTPAGSGSGCGCGGCGCGGNSSAAAEAPAPALSIDARIDVRALPHAQRHATVLAAVDAVPADGALVLVAPHAPLPLLTEIDRRYAGQFATEWLQDGPDVWQVRLQRAGLSALSGADARG
ncbi:DUF2249 domain-containing protein [Couchioplanes caeruleus]|uniref:DUF2249 domain-containing protein n=1 Tax=Couchioplanes caeruleus TaxID=56438 RepID=UPI0020C043F5|nr:DUF2249 domain-containing protein [Couchioplanes caeruleus]UQU67820.1 DUF2249 domain-containing protein [Couchioplanes caeruleus]